MQLPGDLAVFVEGCAFEPIDLGCSGSSVFRLTRPDVTLFLKTAPTSAADRLADEAARLEWLNGRAVVPKVLCVASEDGVEYLLMTSLNGPNGVEMAAQNPRVAVTGVAQALRRLHAESISECPFDETFAVRVPRARTRARLGLVDTNQFDDERSGLSVGEALRELDHIGPVQEERVLTHGDACLPNIIFIDDVTVGFVDCGRAGIADRYQDLALAARSIATDLGKQWADVFFDEYGCTNRDERKLAAYRLLDEFF